MSNATTEGKQMNKYAVYCIRGGVGAAVRSFNSIQKARKFARRVNRTRTHARVLPA